MSQLKTWVAHAYQKQSVLRGLGNKYHGFFLDPGLGKTTIILQILKTLLNAQEVKACLVVAPLRPCFLVWPLEVQKWTNFNHLKVNVLHAESDHGKVLTPGADIYTINPEGLPWLLKELKALGSSKNWPFDMLVVDESTKFKNMSTQRFKNLKKLIPKMKRRYILTGSPVANSLLDIQGQLAIVDMGETFGLTKKTFRDSYFTQYGKPEFQQFRITSKEHEEKIYKKASKYILRLAASDYLKLPKRIYNIIDVELPKKASKIYTQVEKEYFAVLDGEEINAELEVQQRIKCRQIANGRVYASEDILEASQRQRTVLSVHAAKAEAVLDLVDQLQGSPLFIGYYFEHDLAQLKETFGSRLYNIGKGVSMKECKEIERKWNSGEIDLLAAFPGSAALGLNLQGQGRDVCFFGAIESQEDFDQFIKRIERQGNKHRSVTVHMLQAKDTLDKVLLQRLYDKEAAQLKFLDRVQFYRKTKFSNSAK